jgi:hypothetical protein
MFAEEVNLLKTAVKLNTGDVDQSESGVRKMHQGAVWAG